MVRSAGGPRPLPGSRRETGDHAMTTNANEPIPMWRPHIGPEVIQAATQALEIGYLGLGKATKQFEDELGNYLGLDEVYEIAAEHGLRVIEDAAHAIGTRRDGKLVGATGDLVCFSFGPVKTMTTLEGVAIVTPNPEELQTLHQLRMLGVDKETEARYQNRRAWEYDVLHQGFRYHLGAIPASIGLAQLTLLDELVRNRPGYCRGYNHRLAGIPEVITPDS